LILVINPVVQYTVFEQLKNFLIASRTDKLRAAGAATAVAILSDWDFFFLGALSKLGMIPPCVYHLGVDKASF
jgi:adenine nucleotide transporter 17